MSISVCCSNAVLRCFNKAWTPDKDSEDVVWLHAPQLCQLRRRLKEAAVGVIVPLLDFTGIDHYMMLTDMKVHGAPRGDSIAATMAH